MSGFLNWIFQTFGPGVLLFIAFIGAPTALSYFVAGANLFQILCAYAIFYLGLFLLLGHGQVSPEVFGFTLIFAMFGSWLGIPLVAAGVRMSGFLG
jgi:hydrogenase-4 membrane subunit HyfE